MLQSADNNQLKAVKEAVTAVWPEALIRKSPRYYRTLLIVDCDGRPKPLREVIEPWQKADFEAMDPAWECMLGYRDDAPYMRAYRERPRGHSKTTDIAITVTWALYASSLPIRGVAAASDKDQAKLLRNAINMLVSLNPWLGLDVQNYRIVNRKTGAELEIISSDEGSSYGETPHFIIVDELTHWKKRGLWDSLISSAAKRSRCVMVVIANAGLGQGTSWQWEAREACRNEAGWHFSRLDGPQASWITEETLAEQRRLLPGLSYIRLWENRWVADTGEGLPMDQVHLAASKLTGPDDPRAHECPIEIAGLDLGLNRDHAAFARIGISYTSAVYRLSHITSWAPSDFTAGRIHIGTVVGHIIAEHQRKPIDLLLYDPWQAARAAEELTDAGIPCLPVPYTPANCNAMALRIMRVLNDAELELWPDPGLLAALAKLIIKERPEGYKLEALADKETGHADKAMALVLAIFGAVGWVTEMAGGNADNLENAAV